MPRRFTAFHEWLCVVLTCVLLLATPAVPALEPFYAEYKISSKRMGIEVGRLERRLEQEAGNRYRYQASSSAVGLADLLTGDRRNEHSLFVYTAGVLQVLEYSYRRDGNKQQYRQARFDWDNARLFLDNNGTQQELELQPGTVDRLSSELVFMQHLQRGRLAPVYHITNGGTVHDYRLEVLQQETSVPTPLGPLQSIQLLRRRTTSGAERKTLIWCAPELNYLPVRIEGNTDAFVAELIYYRSDTLELKPSRTPAAAPGTPGLY